MKKLLVTFIILLLSLASNIVIADRGSNQDNAISAEDLEYERKINAVIVKEARIRAETNPGFRDLKPGIAKSDYQKNCNFKKGGDTCYGIQNIKFSTSNKSINGVKIVHTIVLDMGPISSDGFFIEMINELIDSDSNIYLKMKKNFDSKYVLDFEFSERDRQLFNEGMKYDLLAVYSKGQVTLKINRNEGDLWLYIEYRDVISGKSFLNANRPVKATLDDF